MENTLLALVLAGVMWYGEIYLEYCPGGEYVCPSYCDVDHIHLIEDCNENKKKQEAYKQRLSESNTGDAVQDDGDTVSAELTD